MATENQEVVEEVSQEGAAEANQQAAIDSMLGSALADRVEETPKEEAPAAEAPEQEETPTEEATTVDLNAPEQVEETQKTEETPEQETKSEVEKLIDLDNFEKEQKEAIKETPTEEVKTVDYTGLATRLGVEGKTEDDIVNAIERIKSEANEKKELNNSVFQKADELYTNGGDWKSFLVSETTRETIENMSSMDLLKDKYKDISKNDENFNLEEYIEERGSADISIQAQDHKKSLLSKLDQEQDRIQRESARQKQEVDNGINDALSRLESVDGFTVSEIEKEAIASDLKSGKAIDDMWFDSEGNKNYTHMAKQVFKLRNYDRIMSYMKSKTASETTRKIVNKMGNQDIMDTKPNRAGDLPSEKPEVAPALSILEDIKSRAGQA